MEYNFIASFPSFDSADKSIPLQSEDMPSEGSLDLEESPVLASTPRYHTPHTDRVKSEFCDDCGIWETSSGPKSVYLVSEEEKMIQLVSKAEQYCKEKMVNKKPRTSANTRSTPDNSEMLFEVKGK